MPKYIPQVPYCRIYIPTLGRIGKQTTLDEFLTKSNHVPALVCPPQEEAAHRAFVDPRVEIVPCAAKGIGPTRQWILENSDAQVVILIDDDMKFQKRVDMESTKLQQCEAGDLDDMINECLDAVKDGYAHGGISARQGNNNVKTKRKENLRMCNFHFLHKDTIMQVGARFDQLEVMEDFHFILSMLTRGYPNVGIFNYCWNQRPGSIGGCNTYRTLEVQARAAEGLKEAFPDFVKVVEKHSETGWSIAQGTRKDVRVQWAKAFKSSQ